MNNTLRKEVEGNVLIAVFDGHIRNDGYSGDFSRFKHWNIEPYGWFDDVDLKYHSSWDWLMPVVEKIRNFKDGEYDAEGYIFGGLSVHISDAYPTGWNCHILGTLTVLHITPQKAHTYSKLEPYSNSVRDLDLKRCVWLSIVAFIKWYNNQVNIDKK